MAVHVYGAADPLARTCSPRYEYVRVQTGSENIAGADEILRQMGLAGWELVSTVFTTSFVHLWLKRPQGQ